MFVLVAGYLRQSNPQVPFTGKILIIASMLVFGGLLGGFGLWLVFR
jgi:hypothetical protein